MSVDQPEDASGGSTDSLPPPSLPPATPALPTQPPLEPPFATAPSPAEAGRPLNLRERLAGSAVNMAGPVPNRPPTPAPDDGARWPVEAGYLPRAQPQPWYGPWTAAPNPSQGWPQTYSPPPGYAPGYSPPPAYPPGYGWPQGYSVPPAYGWPPGYAAPPASGPPTYGPPPPTYGAMPGSAPAAYGWPPVYDQSGPGWGYAPQAPTGWGYAPNPWTYPAPYSPWGYAPPPAEAPGKLHPDLPPRPIRSIQGRATPRMYVFGWLATLVGLAVLLALLAAGYSGIAHGTPAVVAATVLEFALVALSFGLVAAALAQGSQRRADGWQDYFGPSPFLLVLAWLALSLAGELALGAAFDLLGISPATSIETLLILLINLICYWALVHVVAIRPGALSWRDLVRPRHLAADPSDWSYAQPWTAAPVAPANSGRTSVAGDAGIGLALAVPVLIGTLIFTAILAVILGVKNTDVSEPLPTLFPGWDLWITLLSLAVVAPIGEEVFFRGFATNAWARSLKRNDAIIRAALFFACIHLINLLGAVSADVFVRSAILAVAGRIPVAWVLSWIYVRRRSIFASLALHGAYNGSLVVLVWWASTLRFS
jgi:membrane protease YdiL (CAAX protease family)